MYVTNSECFQFLNERMLIVSNYICMKMSFVTCYVLLAMFETSFASYLP